MDKKDYFQIPVQPNDNHMLIENAVSNFKKQAKEKQQEFDENGFRVAAEKHLEKNKDLTGFDGNSFLKKREGEFIGSDKKFSLLIKDGKFIALGSEGTILYGNSFEEVNDKVCYSFLCSDTAIGKEAKVEYTRKDIDQQRTFARSAILKFRMTVVDSGPSDPQFWKDLKNEFLANKENTPELWERITRFIPDEVMLRSPEERERNRNLRKIDDIDKLRGTSSFRTPPYTQASPLGSQRTVKTSYLPDMINASRGL